MTERTIEVAGVDLGTEPFGDPGDPAVLLVAGLGSSMLWWDEAFCRLLADDGRYVIRYDHRDTGRSTAYEPGHPGYRGADLTTDAAAVLDAYAIGRAHVVGVSAGGGIAQELALASPHRIASLTLVSTSPAVAVDRDLPPPTATFTEFFARVSVDWSDDASVVEYLVGYSRVLAGTDRPFDEEGYRDLVRRDVERTVDIASVQNHDFLDKGTDGPQQPLSSISAPTLVVHGTADPLFPPAHGRALADLVPEARLLLLEGAGHGVDRADWPIIVPEIIRHTAGSPTG